MRLVAQIVFFGTTALCGLFEGAIFGRYTLNSSNEAPQTRGYTGFFTGAVLGLIVGGIVAALLVRRLSTAQIALGIAAEILLCALTAGGLYVATRHLGVSW